MEILKISESLGFKLENYNKDLQNYSIQRWLREVRNIHVNPIPLRCSIDNTITSYFMGEIYNSKGKELYAGDDTFNSYEESLEAGLYKALKLIKND